MSDADYAALTVLGQAIEAAFPILRAIEPGEPEAFLGYTTLMHELAQRGYRVTLAPPDGPDAPPLTDLRQIGAAMAREEQAWQQGRAQGASELTQAVQALLTKMTAGHYGELPAQLLADAKALLAANPAPKPS